MEKQLPEECLNPPGFLNTCGVRYDQLDDDSCTASCELRPELCNMHGHAHGGLIFALMDTAASRAAAHYHGMNRPVVSQCAEIHFLRKATGKRLITKSRVRHSGRTRSFVTVELFADDSDTILAIAEFEVFNLG